MLDRRAHVRVAGHAKARHELDAVLSCLAESVCCATLYCYYYPAHQSPILSQRSIASIASEFINAIIAHRQAAAGGEGTRSRCSNAAGCMPTSAVAVHADGAAGWNYSDICYRTENPFVSGDA